MCSLSKNIKVLEQIFDCEKRVFDRFDRQPKNLDPTDNRCRSTPSIPFLRQLSFTDTHTTNRQYRYQYLSIGLSVRYRFFLETNLTKAIILLTSETKTTNSSLLKINLTKAIILPILVTEESLFLGNQLIKINLERCLFTSHTPKDLHFEMFRL